jgi:hypothetical protein
MVRPKAPNRVRVLERDESLVPVTVRAQERRYFEQARRTGLYGFSLDEVIKRLALDKAETLVVQGLLNLERK